jgi:hypothetical protein
MKTKKELTSVQMVTAKTTAMKSTFKELSNMTTALLRTMDTTRTTVRVDILPAAMTKMDRRYMRRASYLIMATK